MGRAIIWDDNSGEGVNSKQMDTIYHINHRVYSMMVDYRDKNCKGKFSEVSLDYVEFDYYPFMDTFMYLSIEDSIISKHELSDGYVLNSQDGNIQDGTPRMSRM